jgi:hypothetical protein
MLTAREKAMVKVAEPIVKAVADAIAANENGILSVEELEYIVMYSVTGYVDAWKKIRAKIDEDFENTVIYTED